MKFAVTYLKVKELKDGTLEFDGPIIGPVVPTRDEADMRTKAIVASSKNMAIMPKIYKVEGDYTIDSIKEMCNGHFDRLKRNIAESKEITDKPIKRSK